MVMTGAWVETEFESIFREHFARLVRTARRVLRSDAEAEEVCSYRAGWGCRRRLALSGGDAGGD